MAMFRVGYFDEFLTQVPRLDKVGDPGRRHTLTHRERDRERTLSLTDADRDSGSE